MLFSFKYQRCSKIDFGAFSEIVCLAYKKLAPCTSEEKTFCAQHFGQRAVTKQRTKVGKKTRWNDAPNNLVKLSSNKNLGEINASYLNLYDSS